MKLASEALLTAVALVAAVTVLDGLQGGLLDDLGLQEHRVADPVGAVWRAPVVETAYIAGFALIVATLSLMDGWFRSLLMRRHFEFRAFRFGNMTVVFSIVVAMLVGFLGHRGWYNPAGAIVFGLSAYYIVRSKTFPGILTGGLQAWLFHFTYNCLVVLGGELIAGN